MSIQSITKALRDERYRIGSLDPIQKGKDSTALIAVLQREMAHVSTLRKTAYTEVLRDYGSTYGDCAKFFNVSRQRVHSIVKRNDDEPRGLASDRGQ